MEQIFKPVPSIPGMTINEDGTVIYYKGKVKNIKIRRLKSNEKSPRKMVLFGKYHKSVSRLVYEAFVSTSLKSRKIIFIDGDCLNTHYKNLGPVPIDGSREKGMRQVPGYDDTYVNNNGTVICQYGLERAITLTKGERAYVCNICGSKRTESVYLSHMVARAFCNWNGRGFVVHKDGDQLNNHFSNLVICSKKQYSVFRSDLINKNRGKYNKDKAQKIPLSDVELVKKRVLNGESLRSIAKDYNCSDLAIGRFRRKYLTKRQIDAINKGKNINTTHTPQDVIDEVVKHLKEGMKQYKIAYKFGLSTSVVCRINRKYIKEAQ